MRKEIPITIVDTKTKKVTRHGRVNKFKKQNAKLKAKQEAELFELKKAIKGVLRIVFIIFLSFTVGFLITSYLTTKASKNSKQIIPTTKKVLIKYNYKNYSVQVREDRIKTMKSLGYSNTKILDLLAIMNMECGKYRGDCFNGNDVGPMQINKIHKEQYNKSWKYYNKKDWGKLFIYQLKYANQLLDSYDKRFCGEHIFKQIGKTYSNKKRWNCIAFSYNGHPRYKYDYAKLGWDRREVIKKLIFK